MAKYEGLARKLKTVQLRVQHVLTLGQEVLDGADQNKTDSFIFQCENSNSWSQKYERIADQMVLGEKPESYNEEEFHDMVIGFDDLIAEVRVMLGRLKRSQPEVTEQKHEVTAARLPNIKLPNFSGILEEWTSFISLFKLLVDQNTTIYNVEKLQYLRLSLQGEPLELIRGLDLTDEKYGIAMRLLQDRYENIRKIAVSHADKLLNFPVSQVPSAKHMRNLIASYREHVEAFRSLKILNSESSGTTDGLFLFLILVRELDRETKCQFERTLDSSKDIPTPETLIDFLEREAQALEASDDKSRVDANRKVVSTRTMVLVTQHAKKSVCCDKQADHPLYRCKSFVQLSAVDRKQFIQQHRLCFICFEDHLAGKCQSSRRCVKCNGKHNSMIHTGGLSTVPTSVKSSLPLSEPVNETGVSLFKDTEASTEALTASFAGRRDGVLLPTALIGVRTGTGHVELVRALYDTGSQASYITTHCARRLKLDFQHQNVREFGLARRDVVVKASVLLHMSNRRDSKHILSTEAYVLDKITADLPVTPLPSKLKDQVGDIFLADPEFEAPALIDCLLGADVFARVLVNGRMELGPGRPVLFNTRFGWILMGSTALASLHRKETLLVSCTAIVEDHLDQMLRRFWSMEEPPQKHAAPSDSRAGEHFSSTHSRDSNGKYIVRLPFENTELTSGESRQMAESRFFSLERRFTRSPELLAAYKDFMQEYEEVGHLQLIPDKSVETSGPVRYYYMPHHSVIKPSSSTTKLRVVFDASAKTTSQSQCSLNDLLLSGPKLQKDITKILLRFRTHAVAFTADVKQMFRNVWIHLDDRCYQLILWRDSADQPLRTYQLNTVTFGVTSSPYLAMKTILQLTQDEGKLSHGRQPFFGVTSMLMM